MPPKKKTTLQKVVRKLTPSRSKTTRKYSRLVDKKPPPVKPKPVKPPPVKPPPVKPKPVKISVPATKSFHKREEFLYVTKHKTLYRIHQGEDIDPAKEGFKGYKNFAGAKKDTTKLNAIYGDDTVWGSKTLDQATRYFYEKLKPEKFEGDKSMRASLYKIDTSKDGIVEIKTQRPEALVRFLNPRNKKEYDLALKWVKTYQEGLGTLNGEAVIKPVSKDRVTKVRDFVISKKNFEAKQQEASFQKVKEAQEQSKRGREQYAEERAKSN